MTAVSALVHDQCGHVAGIANDDRTRTAMQAQAVARGLPTPPWRTRELEIDDAIARLIAGPCKVCRIERIP